MVNSWQRMLLTALLLSGLLVASEPYVRGQATTGVGVIVSAQNPYTVEFKVTTVRTLANGTTITRETKIVQAKDSQSRVLEKSESASSLGDSHVNAVVTVRDSVEGTTSFWQSRTHEVDIQKSPPPEVRHGCWQSDSGRMSANYKSAPTPKKTLAVEQHLEDLGSDIIEGVEVRGQRLTRTTPAGANGNDRPLVTTEEFWMAPSLGGLVLRSVIDNPEFGKTTREVVHLELGEPDPSIFKPPSDYKVKVEEMHQIPCDQLPH